MRLHRFLVLILSLPLAIAGASLFASGGESQNVLLYGDAGRGSPKQFSVGQGMTATDHQDKFDFALALGDNQYIGSGSEVMQKIFEDPYKTLIQRGLVFYQTFGNHDMEFGRHNAQLKYSLDRNVLATGKGGWAIPADDYVITRGDLKIVVTNTAAMDLSVVLPPSRLQWLEKSLCHSQERWVFLAMHYPFWSSNKHGDNLELQKTLSPLLKSCRIDGLLAGHDHGAEVLQTPLDLKQFVIGNAAESRMPDGDTSGVSEWRSGSLGFGGLKISGGEAVLTFYDERGQAIHTVSLQARNP